MIHLNIVICSLSQCPLTSLSCCQSCLTLCDPIDCHLQGSFVQGILQVRMLECEAISWFRDLLDSRLKPMSLLSPALAGIFFTTESPGKPLTSLSCHIIFFFFWREHLQSTLLATLNYVIQN